MGEATFEPGSIPCTEPLLQSARSVGGTTLPLTAVGVGNPHCVVFLSDPLDKLPWRAWGKALECSPWFPNRTNVQFALVVDEHTVEIRIWERGAGETSASGSSACAVAAAAVKLGHCAGQVAVLAPGGRLDVTVGPDFDLVLRGPVTAVGTMTWAPPRVRD
jgi:diaminopimelate epimerase